MPKAKRGADLPPIQIGERIADTDLFRRSQAGRNIHPIYIGSRRESVSQSCDKAFAQANELGLKMVAVAHDSYLNFSGTWYLWWHHSFNTLDT